MPLVKRILFEDKLLRLHDNVMLTERFFSLLAFFGVVIKYIFVLGTTYVCILKNSASKNILIYDILPLSNFPSKNSTEALNTKAMFV